MLARASARRGSGRRGKGESTCGSGRVGSGTGGSDLPRRRGVPKGLGGAVDARPSSGVVPALRDPGRSCGGWREA